MSLPPFASVGQLDDRLPGGSGSVDLARKEAALDDASALVRAEARRNWTKVEGNATVLDLPSGNDEWRAGIVVRVTLAAAVRALSNPEGITQEKVGTYEVNYGGARSSDVYLTTAEKVQIRRAAGLSGVWTQPTTRGPLETAGVRRCLGNNTEYLPTSDGSYIPWA